MAKVTLKGQISGTRNGKPWPKPGDTIDLPADEADSLIAQGMAEKPKSKKSDSGDK